jgi:hypothetical protein
VQVDEKWSFVAKKEQRDRADPAIDPGGNSGTHTAVDAESRMMLSVMPGRQSPRHTLLLVEDVRRRTGSRLLELLTSDEYPDYTEAILEVYGHEV